MITTIAPIITETSGILNELTEQSESKRLTLVNRAIRATILKFKFKFRIKSVNLSVVSASQEFDLTSSSVIASEDYDETSGIYEVYLEGSTTPLAPVDYADRGLVVSGYYLTPDRKTLGFTSEVEYPSTVKVYYLASHKNVAATTDTLNVKLPDAALEPICTYVGYLVHKGKRQRNDARNAILEFQEQVEELRMKDASGGQKYLTKQIKSPFGYTGFRRVYTQ